MNFSVNKFLLAYLNKKSQIQNERLNTEITQKKAKERSLQAPPFLLCFTFVCIKMYITNF